MISKNFKMLVTTSNPNTTEHRLQEEVLILEETGNKQGLFRFHIEEDKGWKLVSEEKPETGIEILGYSPDWIDEDFNPDGICLCFLMDEGYWIVAKWCGQHDEWHTRPTGEDNWEGAIYDKPIYAPTHWMPKPNKPI